MIAGLVLSIIGSQVVTAGLVSQDENLESGKSIEISVELDPLSNEIGVFVVQVMNFNEDSIYASIVDPLGVEIISVLVDKESFEERFEINTAGKYILKIKNQGEVNAQIAGLIGHMPQTGIFSIGITGFYLLIVGIIGVVLVGMYAIKNRKDDN